MKIMSRLLIWLVVILGFANCVLGCDMASASASIFSRKDPTRKTQRAVAGTCLAKFMQGFGAGNAGYGAVISQCLNDKIKEQLSDCKRLDECGSDKPSKKKKSSKPKKMKNPFKKKKGGSPMGGAAVGKIIKNAINNNKNNGRKRRAACRPREMCVAAVKAINCDNLAQSYNNPDCDLCQMLAIALKSDDIEKCACSDNNPTGAAVNGAIKSCISKMISEKQISKKVKSMAGSEAPIGFLKC